MTAAAVCQLSSVRKSYRGRVALDDVSLTVRAGEMIAVVGPSGSGKSTLLNIVGLLDTADHGKLELFGRPAPTVGSRGATELLRKRLSYLFQNFALVDNLTVRENLSLAQAYENGTRKTMLARQGEVLRQFGLEGMLRRRVFELSGGEQQRVALARLHLKRSDLIVADEPTGSLDGASRAAVLQSLRSLRDNGKAILIVTHDPVVEQACDRSVRLGGEARGPQ